MTSTVQAVLRSLRDTLVPAAQESALAESELILQHVLGCDRSTLYLRAADRVLDERESARVDSIALRRGAGEPLAYVLGVVHFCSLELAVSPDVLIPRPETEILVEAVLANEQAHRARFVDMGIGSGAISAALLNQRPFWTGIGIDSSFAALRIARRNCPADRLGILSADVLSCVKNPRSKDRTAAANKTLCATERGFDFIVSNPPYVSDEEMLQLDESVRLFEPRQALAGGKEGTDFYAILATKGKDILKRGGRLYCEIGSTQGVKVPKLLGDKHWENIRVLSDLAQRPRVVMAVCNNL